MCDEYHLTLTRLYKKCLELANKKPGVQSIAVPVIEAEQTGRSKAMCADALATAIELFDSQETRIRLRAIWIVSIDQEAMKLVKA